MSHPLHVPTIAAIDDAPERTVLSVLQVCATNAERIVLSRNPDNVPWGQRLRHEPPDTPAPLTVASRHLLGRISELKNSIALYEAALSASLFEQRNQIDERDDCDLF